MTRTYIAVTHIDGELAWWPDEDVTETVTHELANGLTISEIEANMAAYALDNTDWTTVPDEVRVELWVLELTAPAALLDHSDGTIAV